MPAKTVFIIDAHAYLHKCYHAIRNLSNSKGEEVGALYGFYKMLSSLIKKKKPDYVAVCFDSSGKTFRNEIFTEYKANRKETDAALKNQLNIARDLTKALGLKPLFLSGYEADDIISTAAREFSEKNIEVIIVSGDKDVAQLVGKNIKLWDAQKPSYTDEEEIFKKFGVKPDKILDYLSLIGDSSDNVPGAQGIGPKGALKLFSRYGCLDEIIAAALNNQNQGEKSVCPEEAAINKLLDKVRASLDNIALSKRLIKLNNKAPIEIKTEDFIPKSPEKEILDKMAERLEFKGLMDKSASLNMAPGLFDGINGIAASGDIDMPEFCSLSEVLNSLNSLVLFAEKGYIAVGGGGKAFIKAEEELSEDEKNELTNILTDEKIFKACYNLKKIMHISGFCFPSYMPRNFSDALIAYHLLNPSDKKSGLTDVLRFSHSEDDFKRLGVLLKPLSILDEKLNIEIKEKGLYSLYKELELPLIGIIYSMERSGIKMDKAFLENLSEELAFKIKKLQIEIFDLSGQEINLNSPKQLAELIYKKLNIQLDEKNKKIYKTKIGYSTSEEALLSVKGEHPVITNILKYRELSKLKSSFVDNLLNIIAEDSRAHTTYEQDGTATGRFSSSKPNLQNIPIRSEYGAKIRKAFIAKEGFCLISADYSQIDLRVLAHLSGDENLIASFLKNEDIHKRTAAEVFKVEENKVTPEMRRLAKAINFGIVYGQTAYGLAHQLNIKGDEAQKYIVHYFELYKGVKSWIDCTIAFAKEKGYVATLTGRRRNIPDIDSKNISLKNFAQRIAVNTPVQGGSADIIKKAMINVFLKIKDLKLDAKMLMQVHDELIFEVKDDIKTEVSNIIAYEMENAFKLKVPITVELKSGKNWADMEKISL
ncbi:MAG: DNA polymerase I [Elusimicrobia bacterium]|nr:DNA polymerase I [Elusimicrobiota bacterium]